MMHLLTDINLQATISEEIFFSSGKAPVVLGVGVIILIGIGVWLFKTDKKLSALEDQITSLENDNSNTAK